MVVYVLVIGGLGRAEDKAKRTLLVYKRKKCKRLKLVEAGEKVQGEGGVMLTCREKA